MVYFLIVLFLVLIAVVLWVFLSIHPVVQHQKAINASINRLDQLFEHHVLLGKTLPEVWKESGESMEATQEEEVQELAGLYQAISDADAQVSCDILTELHDTVKTLMAEGAIAHPHIAAADSFIRHQTAIEESRKAINHEAKRLHKLSSRYNHLLTVFPNTYTAVFLGYGEVEPITIELN